MSTNARHRGGWPCSSDEGAVMALELRGLAVQLNLLTNFDCWNLEQRVVGAANLVIIGGVFENNKTV